MVVRYDLLLKYGKRTGGSQEYIGLPPTITSEMNSFNHKVLWCARADRIVI
jgi:hypothetical protein